MSACACCVLVPKKSDVRNRLVVRLVIRLAMKGLREWCRIGGKPLMEQGIRVLGGPEGNHAFE